MKQHEQAQLLMAKAAEDEAILDEILDSRNVTDAGVGFHFQQAVEKLLKAVLSQIGTPFRRTHNLRVLMDLLTEQSCPVPESLEDLDELTPYAATLRYQTAGICPPLDRAEMREKLRQLRRWAETHVAG